MATPVRTLRVDDETWARWQASAEDRGYALGDFIKACVEEVLQTGGLPKQTVWKTASGRVLTDADIQKLADEAERGYDVEQLKARPRRDWPPGVGDLARKDVTPVFKEGKKK